MKHKEKYMKFVALLLVVVLGSISFFQYQRRSEKPKGEKQVVASVEEENKTAGSKKKQAEGSAAVVEGEAGDEDSDLEIRKIEPEIDEESIAAVIEESGSELTVEEAIETYGNLDMEIGSSEEDGIKKTIVSTKNTTVVSVNDEESEVLKLYSLDKNYTVEEADQVDLSKLEPVLTMEVGVARQPMTGRFDGHSVESIYCDSTAQSMRYTYTYGTHALGYGWEHIVSMGGLTDTQIWSSDYFVSQSQHLEKTLTNLAKSGIGIIPVVGQLQILMDAILQVKALEGVSVAESISYAIDIIESFGMPVRGLIDVGLYLTEAMAASDRIEEAYDDLKGSANFATYSSYLNPEQNAKIKPTFVGAISNPFKGALTGHEGFDYLEFTVPYAANYTLSWSSDLSLHVKFCESDRVTVLSEDYRTAGTLNQYLEPGTYYISVTPYSDPVAVVQYNLTLMHDSQETWLEYELDPAEDEVAVPLIYHQVGPSIPESNHYVVCYFQKGSRYIFAHDEEWGYVNAYSSEPFRYERVIVGVGADSGYRSPGEVRERIYRSFAITVTSDEIKLAEADIVSTLKAGQDYVDGKISYKEAMGKSVDGDGVRVTLDTASNKFCINIDFDPEARNAVVATTNGKFIIYSNKAFNVRTIIRKSDTDGYVSSTDQTFILGKYSYTTSNAFSYTELIEGEVWTDEEAAKNYVMGN